MTSRILLLAAFPFASALAQSQAGSARPDIVRDRDLEAKVEARREEITVHVRPETHRRILGAVRSMTERIRSGHAGDLAQLARNQVTVRFGKLKPQQTDLLAFCILAETVHALANPGKADEALAVDVSVDVLQSASLAEALGKESALMSAAAVMLQWIERVPAKAIANVR